MEKKKIKSEYIKKTSLKAEIKTNQLIKRLEKVESRSMHGQLPIVWKSAKDFYVYDISGNKLIDFTSTIFVANTGHANERIKNILKGL